LHHLSSLNVDENPNGEGGILTYTLGASDTNSPTYSLDDLTLAEVQAETDLSGKYFFIKVHHDAVASKSYTQDASSGDVEIDFYR